VAFDRGQEIKRAQKRPHPPKSHVVVVSDGERKSVEIRHVSRETLNRPPWINWDGAFGIVERHEARRARRKLRVQLRKRRGWR
jgi:hypothetical protein